MGKYNRGAIFKQVDRTTIRPARPGPARSTSGPANPRGLQIDSVQ